MIIHSFLFLPITFLKCLGEVYTAVQQYNLGLDNFQLHVLGGNAASVAPVGYSMQGGLSGNNAGRLFGFGADQFLQLEMM